MGGRIVYASRIPPRPKEAVRVGGYEDWRGRWIREGRNVGEEKG